MRIITRNALIVAIAFIPVACDCPIRTVEAGYLHHEGRGRHRQQAAGRRSPDQGRGHRIGELRRGHRSSGKDRFAGRGRGRRWCSACDDSRSRTVRRTGRDSASGGHSQRSHSRPADRGLLHRFRWGHDGDRWAPRQRPAFGARLCGHQGIEWALMQRFGCRCGRCHKRGEGWGHHYHPSGHAAWMGEHSRSCRLPQLPSVGWHPDGRLRAPVHKK